MPKFSEWLFGSPDKLKKIPTGTQEQQNLHNSVIQNAMSMGQQGGGYQNAQNYYNNFLGPNQQQSLNQFSQPYLQQFEEQLLPQIAERFAGGGALSSSGFGQAVGGAASGLQAQLAQLFSQLQGQAAQAQYGQYNQQTQTGLNHQQFAYNKQQGSAGLLPSLFSGLGSGLGSGLIPGISSLFKSNSSPAGAGGGNGMFPGNNTSGKFGLPTFLGM